MSPQVRNGLKQFLLTMVTAATLVLPQPTAWAWQVTINGAANISDAANAVTVDAGGNVVAAGRTMNMANSQGSDFTVVKFSSTIGTELWRRVVRGTGDSNRRDYSGGEPNSVKADTAGNIVAAGHLFNANTGTDFSVVKLSGATGVELWRYSTSGTNTYESRDDIAWAVTVDSANDVVAAGVLSKGNTGRNFGSSTISALLHF